MCMVTLTISYTGRLQSCTGKAGDQLFAGNSSEAAASVHRVSGSHSAGRRDSCHLHKGTFHFHLFTYQDNVQLHNAHDEVQEQRCLQNNIFK